MPQWMNKIKRGIKSHLSNTVGVILFFYYLYECWVGVNVSAPDIFKAVVILVSGLGIVEGVKFSYLGFYGSSEQLGPLYHKRIYMGIGAIAVIWVAVSSINEILLPLVG